MDGWMGVGRRGEGGAGGGKAGLHGANPLTPMGCTPTRLRGTDISLRS